MTRKLLCSVLVQQRASDGRKMSYVVSQTQESADTQLRNAMRFRKMAEQYNGHRKRFYYRVNVYSKGEV